MSEGAGTLSVSRTILPVREKRERERVSVGLTCLENTVV